MTDESSYEGHCVLDPETREQLHRAAEHGFPLQALDDLLRQATENYLDNLDEKGGEGQRWREDWPGWHGEMARANIEAEMTGPTEPEFDEFADAINYLVMSRDSRENGERP